MKLKPIFPRGDETETVPTRMRPKPSTLTADHAAEAERFCEKILRAWFRKMHAFTASDLFWAARRKFIQVGRPWLAEALSPGQERRLADLYTKAKRGEARIVLTPDRQCHTLYCPNERVCRAWMWRRYRIALGMPSRTRRRGRRGAMPSRTAMARFALARRERKPPISWRDIAIEWLGRHPKDHVTKEMVRSAARRRQERLMRRKPK
jgi:hypothetical protein